MEPNPPINVPPSASGGVGPKNNWVTPWQVKAEETGLAGEGSPSISLGLGIGAGFEGSSHVKSPPFTEAQSHELQQQALILKYIAAGLPVPFHLILSVWNNVAGSISSANGEIYNQYPSFVGFCPRGFDYRSMMDPEPGRCRRTDGKKWRCSRDVVPDQKYCERHMHRGRQRSRKYVEASVIPSESGRTFNSNTDMTTTINSVVSANTKRNLSTTIPVNPHLATPSSNTNSITPAAAASTTTCMSSNNGRSHNNVVANKYSTATVYSGNTGSDKIDYGIIGKGSSNIVNNCNVGSFVAPGFGFSTKTVLRVGSCDDYSNAGDSKLKRCRRTDGRKWKCGRDVVPNHKYCGRHLHRGAKKLGAGSQSVTVAAAAPPAGNIFLAPPLAIPKNANGHINSGTDISISIVPSPRQITGGEASPDSSSSSDATTITDENGSVSHLLAMSP